MLSSRPFQFTPIDFDHQKWLGTSLTEIAREKAGIIKPGVPVFQAIQPHPKFPRITALAGEVHDLGLIPSSH